MIVCSTQHNFWITKQWKFSWSKQNYSKDGISKNYMIVIRSFWCSDLGAFNLHLLEFAFVYQFYSRKTTLVESTFWNLVGLFVFMSFHNNFKMFWYCVLLKMRGIFCTYLFWDTANGIWTDNIQSFEISFHLSFELQI